MPIDNATLEQYITEVAGEDQDLATDLRERLTKNQNAAAKFVGGFLGRADVTRKQQEIANQKQKLEQTTVDYEARLTQAETEKNQIMRDLASERITGSRAIALLNTVKQAYSLTDADLPGIDDVKETARTGKVVDSTPDLDDRLKTFGSDLETRLFKKINDQLLPEISGLAILGPIWNEIGYEHEKLFGKRLTKKEQTEILQAARTDNKSLESVWQDKYGVSDKRMEVRDAENRKKWEGEWKDAQEKRNSELALQGVRPESREAFTLEDRGSPLFKKDFSREVDAPTNDNGNRAPASESGNQPGNRAASQTDAGRERLSGADRAAAKFVERARSGQLGKPLERKTA